MLRRNMYVSSMFYRHVFRFSEFGIQNLEAEDLSVFLDHLQLELDHFGICGFSDEDKIKRCVQLKKALEKQEKDDTRLTTAMSIPFNFYLQSFEYARPFFKVDFQLFPGFDDDGKLIFYGFSALIDFRGNQRFHPSLVKLDQENLISKLTSEMSEFEKAAKIFTVYAKACLDWVDNFCNSNKQIEFLFGYYDTGRPWWGNPNLDLRDKQRTSMTDLESIITNEIVNNKEVVCELRAYKQSYVLLRGPSTEILKIARKHMKRTKLLKFLFLEDNGACFNPKFLRDEFGPI